MWVSKLLDEKDDGWNYKIINTKLKSKETEIQGWHRGSKEDTKFHAEGLAIGMNNKTRDMNKSFGNYLELV